MSSLGFHLHTTTHGKHHHKCPLVSHSQLTHTDWLHGQHQYQDICCNGETRVGMPVFVQTDAGRLDRLVPGTSNWISLSARRCSRCNHVTYNKFHERVASDVKPLLNNIAEV